MNPPLSRPRAMSQGTSSPSAQNIEEARKGGGAANFGSRSSQSVVGRVRRGGGPTSFFDLIHLPYPENKTE